MKHCCEEMEKHVTFKCDQHQNKYNCPDAIIDYSDVFDEYSLIIHDDNHVGYSINYCPFCGVKLPLSKRNEWCDKLISLGYETPFFDENIPKEYKSDAWYNTNNDNS